MTFLGETTRVTKMICVNCGAELDAATAFAHRDPPAPGDASVCLECANISVFGENLILRAPTEEERRMLYNDRRVAAAVQAVRQTRGIRSN